jgi:hypothetical protein
MSRPAPKFSVGEKVFVINANDSTVRCEATIIDIREDAGRMAHYSDRSMPPTLYSGFSYELDRLVPGTHFHWVVEYALRKMPPPATESFDQLMRGLKRPQGVVV